MAGIRHESNKFRIGKPTHHGGSQGTIVPLVQLLSLGKLFFSALHSHSRAYSAAVHIYRSNSTSVKTQH